MKMIKLALFLSAIVLTLAAPSGKETEVKEPQVAKVKEIESGITTEVKEAKVTKDTEVKETKAGSTTEVKEKQAGITTEVKEPQASKDAEIKETQAGITTEVKDEKQAGITTKVKNTVKDNNDVEVKNESLNESPIIKEILNKIDKADINQVYNEMMATKSTGSDDKNTESEIKKNDETDVKANKDSVLPAKDNELKNSEKINKLKSSADEVVKDTQKIISDNAINLDNKLRDVAQAVAEAVTSLPIPAKPESFNKYTEIIGHFIKELLQIPMVLLHAVSNAVASLTNNKLNLGSSTLSQTTNPPSY